MQLDKESGEFLHRRRKARWTALILSIIAVLIFVLFFVVQIW